MVSTLSIMHAASLRAVHKYVTLKKGKARRKEPPHPIRVAKTIDVIARITFPVAYSIFLIFFFIHYKGAS
ncbi:unnamed protein product [Bemisia tabaci]|uniref:Uncharacterized protein n=1 Tax=Bemisia tabaci TaxID=7038 RepID=A0A9N9ZYR4_BEMTA|nr:unnamed protein product [Bemisia tabaci]